jgi:hypothetical protein
MFCTPHSLNTALRIAREEESGVGVAKIEEVSVLS